MRVLLTILLFFISLNIHATHTLTYYVYVETEYTQGPWTRANLLDGSQYRYLAAEIHEDLFGSEASDMVNKLLSRLKEKKPEIYNWSYELIIQGDSVFITPKEAIKNIETVKNEITATLVFNNFKTVILYINGQPQVLTLDDLSVPYFDLVTKQTQPLIITDTLTLIESGKNKASVNIIEKQTNPLAIWLVLSLVLNAVLLALWIWKKMANKY